MMYDVELLESKISNIKNIMWDIAVCDKKLSNEQVKWLSDCYDAKKALEWVHEKMTKICSCEDADMKHNHEEHMATMQGTAKKA